MFDFDKLGKQQIAEAEKASQELKITQESVDNSTIVNEKFGAPDMIRALEKTLQKAAEYLQKEGVSERNKRDMLQKLGKTLQALKTLKEINIEEKSTLGEIYKAQLRNIKNSYIQISSNDVTSFAIGETSRTQNFDISKASAPELAAFLVDRNDDTEVNFIQDDIFTEYELYRTLSLRSVKDIGEIFKRVTGKDYNPADIDGAKILRKEFHDVLRYKSNILRTLEPILAGKEDDYIKNLQKEVQSQNTAIKGAAEQIANNSVFQNYLDKASSFFGGQKPNVPEIALQFVNEISRNNINILLNPKSLSDTISQFTSQPITKWLSRTAEGVLGFSFSHTTGSGISFGLNNFVPFIGYGKDILVTEIKDLKVQKASATSVRPEIQFMPGVVYTGVSLQFKNALAEVNKKADILQDLLNKSIDIDAGTIKKLDTSVLGGLAADNGPVLILNTIVDWFQKMSLSSEHKKMVLQAISGGFVNRYRHELVQANSGWSFSGITLGVYHVLGVLKLPAISVLGQDVKNNIRSGERESVYTRAARGALGDTQAKSTETNSPSPLVSGDNIKGYEIASRAILPANLDANITVTENSGKKTLRHKDRNPLGFKVEGNQITLIEIKENTHPKLDTSLPSLKTVIATAPKEKITLDGDFEKQAYPLIRKVQLLSSGQIRTPAFGDFQKALGAALDNGQFTTVLDTLPKVQVGGKSLFSQSEISSISQLTLPQKEILVRSLLQATMGSQQYRNFVNGRSLRMPKQYNHDSTPVLLDTGIVDKEGIDTVAKQIGAVREQSKTAYETAVRESITRKQPIGFQRIEGVIGFTNISQIRANDKGQIVPHFKKIQAIPGSFDATDIGDLTIQEIPNANELKSGLINKIPERTLQSYQVALSLSTTDDVKKVLSGESVTNSAGINISSDTKVLYARLHNCGNDSYLLKPLFTSNTQPISVNIPGQALPPPISNLPHITPVGTSSADANTASIGVLGSPFGLKSTPTPQPGAATQPGGQATDATGVNLPGTVLSGNASNVSSAAQPAPKSPTGQPQPQVPQPAPQTSNPLDIN